MLIIRADVHDPATDRWGRLDRTSGRRRPGQRAARLVDSDDVAAGTHNHQATVDGRRRRDRTSGGIHPHQTAGVCVDRVQTACIIAHVSHVIHYRRRRRDGRVRGKRPGHAEALVVARRNDLGQAIIVGLVVGVRGVVAELRPLIAHVEGNGGDPT